MSENNLLEGRVSTIVLFPDNFLYNKGTFTVPRRTFFYLIKGGTNFKMHVRLKLVMILDSLAAHKSCREFVSKIKEDGLSPSATDSDKDRQRLRRLTFCTLLLLTLCLPRKSALLQGFASVDRNRRASPAG